MRARTSWVAKLAGPYVLGRGARPGEEGLQIRFLGFQFVDAGQDSLQFPALRETELLGLRAGAAPAAAVP
jgi:hypothetical protein